MTKNELNRQLIEAVISNDPKAVQHLIEQGADPNCFEDEAQIRPLHFASLYNAAKVIPMLILAGADIHAVTEYSDTPLTVAKRHNHQQALNALSTFYQVEVSEAQN